MDGVIGNRVGNCKRVLLWTYGQGGVITIEEANLDDKDAQA